MSSFYGKINTLFKRDMTKKNKPIIVGDYVTPEIEALANVKWEATEKIDGTNMSCEYICAEKALQIRGKTDRANIPSPLLCCMQEIFTLDNLKQTFIRYNDDGQPVMPDKVEIFGEGYGYKIQNGGNYIPDHCDFILFDVRVTNNGEALWLDRTACEDIANKMGIRIVPLVGYITIAEACEMVKKGFISAISHNREYIAEGLVLKAPHGLLDRRGERLITKVKHCDFRNI